MGTRIGLATAFLGLALFQLAAAQPQEVRTDCSWIWYPEDVATDGLETPRFLRRVVTLEGRVERASLRVRSDDRHSFWVNGAAARDVVENGAGGIVYDLRTLLHPGKNVLAFEVVNMTGPGGLIAAGEIVEQGGRTTTIRSDTSFHASRTSADGWREPGFDDSSWQPAAIVGSAFAAPWYHHTAFDMAPFLSDADRQRWSAWREPLIRLPEGLAAEPAASATLGWLNGTCVLKINGREHPALIYRGTVDPLSVHGRRQIALFRDAGIHVYTAYMPLSSCWLAEGKFDFTPLDDQVRAYLSVDPDAHLILILRLVPPSWWPDAHQDELVRYAMGSDFNTSDESGRVCRPSLASRVWQEDAMAVWRAAIRHMESAPWGKRVVGYHPGYGIYTEWHYFGSWRQQMPDTGPAMTAAFREWLKDRYGTVAALREAWQRPDATFESATVPGKAPRLVDRPLGMLLPEKDGWVIDYYRCQQQITADVMESFCAAAKEETNGRALAGAFYGYYFGVPPQTQGGHLELERMFRSPAIDYFAAPYDYSHRLVGDDGRGRAVVDAFPLAGKVHMVEVDTRTHLHSRNEYGRVADTTESLAVIRREVATTLLHGSAMWWCDFGTDGSGGWYDQPELIGEVAAMNRLAESLMTTPRHRTSQVALVCDLRSFLYMADGKAMAAQRAVLNDLAGKLKRLGAPVDMIFLSQLERADLSRYRLLVFPHTLRLTEAERRSVARAVEGRTALWLWSPGITDAERFSPSLVRDVTGISVRLEGGGIASSPVVCAADHELTRDIPNQQVSVLVPRDFAPVSEAEDAANCYNPRDKKTMAEQYSQFAWRVDGDTLVWDFATAVGWTDLHLKASIPQCDGIGLTVAGGNNDGQLGLSVVIKGSDGSEFAAPSFPVKRAPTSHVLSIGEFKKARWSRSDAPLSFPLQGMKLVLYGCGDNQPQQLRVSGLAAVRGQTRQSEVKKFEPIRPGLPVLTIDDDQAEPLGRCEPSGAVVLASKGKAPSRAVLATVPNAPLELLRALADEAGVHRYVDRPDVLVGADSALVSLHTKTGGPVTLCLPRPHRVTDAVTGELVGEGQAIPLDLAPVSTTLLRLGELGNQ